MRSERNVNGLTKSQDTAQAAAAPFPVSPTPSVSEGSGFTKGLDAVLSELRILLAPEGRAADDKLERVSPGHLKHVPMINCADGFVMSVQASRFHYCSPRDSLGPWVTVEVGFPSVRVEAFMPYIDGGPDENPTETVYGYVPLTVVAQAILDHGGFSLASGSNPHV